MSTVFPLPRLVLGAGSLSKLKEELALLGAHRPFLLSDRGLERAGAVTKAMQVLPENTVQYLDVPENPTTAGADAALSAYRRGNCDGIVALGGGSVIDTGKFVAALAGSELKTSTELLGNPGLLGPRVTPLIAVPTTVGTGSESSPVSALHADAHSPAIGTRSPHLVPNTAICDPDLARTLPPKLIAATGIDAMAHCIEGYFAMPDNPIVNALALDGLARAFSNIVAATKPDGDEARCSMMEAAFAGGAAIHKGLGPAHAIAIVCGDQGLHHGVLIAAALPFTVELVVRRVPEKASRIASVLGLTDCSDLKQILQSLNKELGLPNTYREAGYTMTDLDELARNILKSHFNRTSPYLPTHGEYRAILQRLQD